MVCIYESNAIFLLPNQFEEKLEYMNPVINVILKEWMMKRCVLLTAIERVLSV